MNENHKYICSNCKTFLILYFFIIFLYIYIFRLIKNKKIIKYPCRSEDGSKIVPIKDIEINNTIKGSCQMIKNENGIQRLFTFICNNCKKEICYQSVPFDVYFYILLIIRISDVLFFEIGSIISDKFLKKPIKISFFIYYIKKRVKLIINVKRNDGEIIEIPRCHICGGWGIDLVKRNNLCDHCNSIEQLKPIPEKRELNDNKNNEKKKKVKSLVGY